MHQIVHSLVLFAWSHYRAGDDEIPPLDNILKAGHELYGVGDTKHSWHSKLRGYGYYLTDELDEVLAEIVRTGYVRGDKFTKAAEKKNEEVIATKADGSFSDAWRTYHDSFDDNQEHVINTLYESFKKNFKYIGPINLGGTVHLFRDLGEDDKADEIIELYVTGRSDEPELFDPDNYAFFDEITDEKILEAFKEVRNRTAQQESLRDVVIKLAESEGWGEQDEVVLAAADADDYYHLFKSESGKHLTSMVNACLKFGQFANPSERQRHIVESTKQALIRIGKESEINRRRVQRKFGIEIEPEA